MEIGHRQTIKSNEKEQKGVNKKLKGKGKKKKRERLQVKDCTN